MKSQFSSYTTLELKSKLKKQQRILILQGIVIFLMLIFSIFSTLHKGTSFHTFLPLFFSPMFISIYLDVKYIKKALDKREENEYK